LNLGIVISSLFTWVDFPEVEETVFGFVNVDLQGQLAVGDVAYIEYGGDFHDHNGNFIWNAFATERIETAGFFTRSLHEATVLYDDTMFPFRQLRTFARFEIHRGAGVTERSWVGFSDPDVGLQNTGPVAVPEPAMLLSWCLLGTTFGLCRVWQLRPGLVPVGCLARSGHRPARRGVCQRS
jgi:hypothetical protein